MSVVVPEQCFYSKALSASDSQVEILAGLSWALVPKVRNFLEVQLGGMHWKLDRENFVQDEQTYKFEYRSRETSSDALYGSCHSQHNRM